MAYVYLLQQQVPPLIRIPNQLPEKDSGKMLQSFTHGNFKYYRGASTFYSSQNITTKSRWMKWVVFVAGKERRNTYKILVEKPHETRPLWRLSSS
jgi:hypothetical protein